MKKALMVMGLAMCSTIAFGQITQRAQFSVENSKIKLSDLQKEAPVDYKASIFTKDANDTIVMFDFNATQWSDSITKGKLSAQDILNENPVGADNAHFQSSARCEWNRIADSVSIWSQDFEESWPNTYQRVRNNAAYLGATVLGSDNGFAMMSMLESSGDGAINAYMAFVPVAKPAGQTINVVDVRLTQLYMCFNADRCYIDYKIDGGWKSVEINVRGVDCNTNDWAAIRPTYTMPFEFAALDSYEIRVRWFSNSNTGGAFGYFWVIDNLALTVGANKRLKAYDEVYADGAYGLQPKGMKIPLSWYAAVSNTGFENVTDPKVILRHAAPNEESLSTVATFTQNGIEAGDPSATTYAYVSERGFIDSIYNGTWWGSYISWEASPYYNQPGVPAGYKSIPVDQEGLQYVSTSVVYNNNQDTISWSAYPYTVTTEMNPDEQSSMVSGYRWGHDNGLVLSGNGFHGGYVVEGGNTLVTDQGAYNTTGYLLAIRYTTGSEIPTDAQGNPWVLRGIEIVTSTDSLDMEGMAESPISPIAYIIDYNDMSIHPVETGFSNTSSYVVEDNNMTMYELGSDPIFTGSGDYDAVNMEFPNQPTLEPNTTYYFGYYVDGPGRFAAAVGSNIQANAQNNYTNIRNDEELAVFTNRFSPDGYDFLLRDPVANYYTITYGLSADEYPMIRAIVGPRENKAEYTINADCTPSNDSVGATVESQTGVDLCGGFVKYYEGASTYVFILPDTTNTHSVIDHIVINGTAYDVLGDDNLPAEFTIQASSGEDFYVKDENDDVLLERPYYVLYIENISSNISLGVQSHWEKFGIDPVAENVFVGVKPNPATSQVNINVSGVAGMVNCSIIDMSGRVVYSNEMNAENVETIDLSNFARGAYFVRITNDTFSKVEKLIVR